MGESYQQFRLRKSYTFWIRIGLVALYLAWAIAFVVLGMRPRVTDAASGVALEIPAITLSTDVQQVQLENHRFAVPDAVAGAYRSYQNKVFIMGHRNTVFVDLEKVKAGDVIVYDGIEYLVESAKIMQKSEVDMSEILADSDVPTLILMTCAGQQITETDFTHRLVVTAVKD